MQPFFNFIYDKLLNEIFDEDNLNDAKVLKLILKFLKNFVKNNS